MSIDKQVITGILPAFSGRRSVNKIRYKLHHHSLDKCADGKFCKILAYWKALLKIVTLSVNTPRTALSMT